jgi:hypothetical protein
MRQLENVTDTKGVFKICEVAARLPDQYINYNFL